MGEQVCIPVGYVPPICWRYPVVSLPGGGGGGAALPGTGGGGHLYGGGICLEGSLPEGGLSSHGIVGWQISSKGGPIPLWTDKHLWKHDLTHTP